MASRLSDILALTDEIRALEQVTVGGEDLPEACKTAEKLVRDRESARGTLSAARLRAELHLEPGVTVTAESADGETREITGTQTLDVDGFVALTIPSVGTLRVAPQTLDVDGLQARIASDQKALEELLHKHDAADESALQALAEAYRENAASLRQKRQALEVRLDGETAEDLQNRLAAIPLDEGLELPETLEADTAAFLRRAGQRTLDAAAAGAETELKKMCFY